MSTPKRPKPVVKQPGRDLRITEAGAKKKAAKKKAAKKKKAPAKKR